jgi:hypothetical protein
MSKQILALVTGLLMLSGCSDDNLVSTEIESSDEDLTSITSDALSKGPVSVSHTELKTFMAAGTEGGGVLTPDTFYPPTDGSKATLRRASDWISLNIHTTGLPPGAYTIWWAIINDPSKCAGACTEADIFFNPATMSSVFWAAGKVVEDDGVGNFRARVAIGDDLGTPDTQYIFGPGLLYPLAAEVRNIVKYHGPASDDPETLAGQLSTILESCFVGANAVDLGAPFGVHCFDPQAAVHLP